MPLTSGTRLGPYETLAPLGAGRMGEVYRARDTPLGREVGGKVLPTHFNLSPEMRARFEREARTVSALNHPHIPRRLLPGRLTKWLPAFQLTVPLNVPVWVEVSYCELNDAKWPFG